jgi:hypothetical protein
MATKKKPLELQGLLGLTFDDATSEEELARAKEEQKVAGKYNRPSNRKKNVKKKKPTPPSLVKEEEPAMEAPEKPQLEFNDTVAAVEKKAREVVAKVTVRDILKENQKRLDKLRLVGIDQRTGEGLPAHTEKVVIRDYPIPVQYLTEEVANNKLYRKVLTLGGVREYVDYLDSLHGGYSGVTEEDVIQKLMMVRLKRDPAFAFIICFFIQDKVTGKTIPYRLNYPQILLLEELESMRREKVPIRLVLLKARQWGGSTLVQLYMAWIQLFLKEGWNSVIIAQTKDTARRIKGMYSRTLANFTGADILFGCPKLKFSPKENSSADSTITNEGGKVMRDNTVTIASFENFEATRGANFAMAHYSEVAYWVNTPGKTAEALITNIAGGMLMAPLTLEVLESTANGMSGYFYDEYQLAKNPDAHTARRAMFIPFFYIMNDTLPFNDDAERKRFAEELLANKDKEYDTPTTESGQYLFSLWKKGASLESINWYIRKRASFHDHASMASEAPSDDVECFKHSGHTIFDQYLVDKYSKEYAQQPMYRGEIMQLEGRAPQLTNRDEEGGLWVWQMPDNISSTEDRYVAVVDVGGRSTKADFSVITVIDRWPLRFGGKVEVVARWRGHIRYDFLALKAVMVARFYSNALLVFESNTFDKKKAESNDYVQEGDHTRGILSTIEDTYENLYMRVSTSSEDIRQGRFKKIGFQTNVKTKQDMVDLFQVAFEDDSKFIERDIRAYQEMSIYEQREDGTYGNIVGRDNHDDILMTDMIALLISEQMPLPSIRESAQSVGWRVGTMNESMI